VICDVIPVDLPYRYRYVMVKRFRISGGKFLKLAQFFSVFPLGRQKFIKDPRSTSQPRDSHCNDNHKASGSCYFGAPSP
jgi:hypothetical protein